MSTLAGNRISNTYQKILQTTNGVVQDGTGSLVTLLNVTSSYALTASFFSGSISNAATAATSTSASYSLTASYALNGGGTGTGTTLNTGSTYPITASWSVTASNAVVAKTITLQTSSAASSFYILFAGESEGNEVPYSDFNDFHYTPALRRLTVTRITSSLYGTASRAVVADSISFVPQIAHSASWVSASVRITTADSASYFNQRWLNTGSFYPISTSFALTASHALNGGGSGTTLNTGSTYPITASWANNVISSSYALTSSYSEVVTYNTTTSYAQTADYAPVIFENVRIIDGYLLLRDPDTDQWIRVSAKYFSSSSYGLIYTGSVATGSILYSGSINCESSSYALTASYAPFTDTNTWLETGSSYPITSSWAETSSYGNQFTSSNGLTITSTSTSSAYIDLGDGFLYGTASWATTASYARSAPNSQVVSSSFADPYTTNAALGDYFRVLVSSNFAFSNPINAYDGQKITWKLKQDAVGGHTCSFGDKFIFSNDLPTSSVILNQTASKSDYLAVIYDADDDKFAVVAFNAGF